MRKFLLITLSLFALSIVGCTQEIDKDTIKQFVIDYDDALSKGWSENDEIIPKSVENFFNQDTILEHCSNKNWFVYNDMIEIEKIDKIPQDDYDIFGNNAYEITYRKKIIYKIENNLLVPVTNPKNYGKDVVYIAPIGNELKVTCYYPSSCWVKEKHLKTLIKRKNLIFSDENQKRD